MTSLHNGCIEFNPGMVRKCVLTYHMMSLRNGCIEFNPGMVGKGVLTCYMTSLRNGCIEFDPGMVRKCVLTCHMSLPKWCFKVHKYSQALADECPKLNSFQSNVTLGEAWGSM